MTATEGCEIRVPIYFGLDGRQLFGCHHYSAAGAGRDLGIVVCSPLGHEYIRAHRSLLQLTRRLVDRGYPVLRFDFYGWGDSAGDSGEGSIDQWLRDVGLAVDELRRRSMIGRVGLVGLRLGGALAALAAERNELHSLVLWDPVIDGRDHLEDLRRQHDELLLYGNIAPPRQAGQMPLDEALGFPLPDRLRLDIEAIDLLAADFRSVDRVLVIESGRPPKVDELRSRLERQVRDAEHLHIPDPEVWLSLLHQAIVPNRLLNAVVTWIEKAQS